MPYEHDLFITAHFHISWLNVLENFCKLICLFVLNAVIAALCLVLSIINHPILSILVLVAVWFM